MNTQILKLESVSKRFKKVQALHEVSCEFQPGITALLGPNGAGKSTMMNIICTLMKQDSGRISYNGQEICSMGKQYLERISVQFQSQPMYKGDTAMEYLTFCGALKGMDSKTVREQGLELLEQFGIADTGRKPISSFSGGMRQRLALVSTFLGDPRIIMLDEPSAGLDIYEREVLKRYLCELKNNRIIIISTHIVSDVENIADNVILLNEGKIYSRGSQQQLISRLEGKVWEIPENVELNTKTYYSNGRRICHSDVYPCAEAVVKQADLTDVYFGCINVR